MIKIINKFETYLLEERKRMKVILKKILKPTSNNIEETGKI
jgi:hypothetical protein